MEKGRYRIRGFAWPAKAGRAKNPPDNDPPALGALDIDAPGSTESEWESRYSLTPSRRTDSDEEHLDIARGGRSTLLLAAMSPAHEGSSKRAKLIPRQRLGKNVGNLVARRDVRYGNGLADHVRTEVMQPNGQMFCTRTSAMVSSNLDAALIVFKHLASHDGCLGVQFETPPLQFVEQVHDINDFAER